MTQRRYPIVAQLRVRLIRFLSPVLGFPIGKARVGPWSDIPDLTHQVHRLVIAEQRDDLTAGRVSLPLQGHE